ncbi:MAG: hypothetical protein DCC75_01645 [Proteobacteria bacterium]|nr:MAG: hypothetical protein DCC75_01645 [Pseudomonadota bacterium]
MTAKRRLDQATTEKTRSFERLSSGMRINRASDDAAGLSISSILKLQGRVFGRGIQNINDGLSALSIADSTLSGLTDIVTRIRELAQQAANGSFSNNQRAVLDREAQYLSSEFFRLSRSARFNGLGLFDGSLAQGLRLQAGFGVDGSIGSSLGGRLGSGSFSTVTSYGGLGVHNNDVALGDLNGDGHLDMVNVGIHNSGASYAQVRLGQGDGTFSDAVTYATEGYETYAVSLADLNNDGILDLVTAGSVGGNDSDGSTTIRLGLGNGTFGNATSYFGGSKEAYLGDLNGDGILDLVSAGVTGRGAGGLAVVRLGLGNGTFGQSVSYAMEAAASEAVALADINNDGKLDLITAGRDGAHTGQFSVRLGQGNGTFGSRLTYETSNDATSLSLGDINGDGKLDIVVGLAGGGAEVRLGQGNGTFGDAVDYHLIGGTVTEASLADVNGDWHLDIVAVGTDGSNLGVTSVRLGNGDGTFNAAVVSEIAPAVTFLQSVALGDLDGDGVLDLVASGYTNNPQDRIYVQSGVTREGLNPMLSFSLATKSDALQAMAMLDRTLSNLSKQRGVIGAFQSRLQAAMGTLITTRENYLAAEGRITDVDVASESAELTRNQILEQTATAILGQANQMPALVLQLLSNQSRS